MIYFGRIVAVHPESHSVDAVFPVDGRRVYKVPVLSSNASSSTGSMDLPNPMLGKGGEKDVARSGLGHVEMQGMFAMSEGGMVCLGFKFPRSAQMMPSGSNREITRHASGVYTSIDGKGNFEFVHPSGAFVRVGEGSDHEDLTGKGHNSSWDIPKTGPCSITVSHGGATVIIDPSGNVSIKANGNMDIKVNGSFNCESGGNMSFKAPRIDMN